MLAALAAPGAGQYSGGAASDVNATGVQAVLFYLAAYGLMNIGAFGILQLLPRTTARGRPRRSTTCLARGGTACAGLCMSVCCFSLTGIPLTVGFMAKLMIIKPALAAAVAPVKTGMISVRPAMAWLAAIVMVNAAISAAYYLRIVATMFLQGRTRTTPAFTRCRPTSRGRRADPACGHPERWRHVAVWPGAFGHGTARDWRTLNASNLEGNIPSCPARRPCQGGRCHAAESRPHPFLIRRSRRVILRGYLSHAGRAK